MRHFESGAARKAAATANIPVINAGDGPGEHPTQVCCVLNLQFFSIVLNKHYFTSLFLISGSVTVVKALLDVYTIQSEIGKLDGISVALVGDLANGRTVRSLAYLLAKFKDVKIYFVSPEIVKMKVSSTKLATLHERT